MSSEEEIDLGGNTVEQPIQPASTPIKPKPSPFGDFKGKSDAELLDALLQAPESQLIPWEQTELPSKGLYYGWTNGVIDVRAWSATVDKALANQRMMANGQAIDTMISHCCKFPTNDFDVKDLLVGDQIYLLYYLRGITFGPEYEFSMACPHCSETSMHNFDLTELASTIKYANPSLGNEPFEIELPHLSTITQRRFTVGVRFLRVRDSSTIKRLTKAKQRTNVSKARVFSDSQSEQYVEDDTLTRNIATVIENVMGNTDKMRIKALVDKMQSSDIATIRDWLSDNTPGMETKITIVCESCSKSTNIMLPITESFFRAKDPRTVRKRV